MAPPRSTTAWRSSDLLRACLKTENRKLKTLPILSWLKNRAWPILARTWEGWQQNDGFLLSAAMAYYAAFSLLPLCLILISIMGYVMRLSLQAQDAQAQLLELVSQNGSPWLAEQLGALLADVKTRAGLGGPIGIIALLLASLGVFLQFDYMFNRIWGTTSSSTSWLRFFRNLLYDRLAAFLMLLAVGAMLLCIFLTNMVLAGVRSYVEQLPSGATAWDWGRFVFTIVTNALLFGIIYKVIPKVRVRWREAIAGGALVSITWIIGQQILVSFVIGESYTAYGVVGSFIALMLWLYYISATIFFGAEFVQSLTLARQPETRESE